MAAKLDLEIICLELATFLQAGLSISESLDMLATRFSQGPEQQFAKQLQEAVLKGFSLSEALEAAKPSSPEVLVALVRSSEQSGQVAMAFQRYAEFSARLSAAKRRITTALIYPSLLLFVGTIVIAFFLFFILPKFAQVYSDLERELPWASQLVVTWGHWLNTHPQTVRLIGILLGVMIFLLATSTSFRAEIAELLFKIPALRVRRREFVLGRFYFTLSVLLESGLPLLQALALSKDVLSRELASKHTLLLREVESGKALSIGLAEAQLGTPLSERLVKSGEASGKLGPMLKQTALIHEADS